jgi:nitrogen fixation NifU-like protein
MSEITDLYQEVILDHGKRPRNFEQMSDCNCCANGHNPLCGDKIRVFARVEDDKVVRVSFSGSGCAISTASASMMTEALQGKTLAEVQRIFDAFHDLVTGKTDPESADPLLKKLIVFAGVREFPVRVKCATLPWHTVRAALESKEPAVTTE